MKFALLGVDAETLALAQGIAELSGHELVWACDVAGAEAELRRVAPRVQIAQFWESLLAGGVADAVIVARARIPTSTRPAAQAGAGTGAADSVAPSG